MIRYELTAPSGQVTQLTDGVRLEVPKLLGLISGPLGNNVKHAVAQNLQVRKQILKS